jgi:hypothetical protein
VRQTQTSRLRDVAGMVYSMRRAADRVLDEYVATRQVSNKELARLDRNRFHPVLAKLLAAVWDSVNVTTRIVPVETKELLVACA